MAKNNQLSDHYFRSLNRNIILIIIIVSVIPLILVGSTIYYQFRASYHAKVYDHLRELVHSHTQNIDSFLQEKLSDIRFLTDSCGRDKLQDESFLQERLAALQKDFGQDFVDLGVINAAGEQIAYAGPFKLAKADYSDAEWFRKAIYAEIPAQASVSPGEVRITVKSDSDQNENIYIAAFLKTGDWLLVYQQRMADAFADLGKTFRITTVLIVIGLIGIIIMAFTLSKTIVRRVARADSEKQLMSKKVVEAGKLASVGELAAGIAHEINNPVAIMVEEAGWMEDLMEEITFDESENQAEFERAIEQIQTQGKRCKEITHKLLSFARKTDATVHDVDINELLEELVALASQRAKYSMVEIRTDFQENLPSLRVSSSELQQVIFNLINNAIDAMDHDGGTLTISSHQIENDLVITVSDTGQGIPEANLDRIFDPFFTTKAVGKGTGLGLSICYGIIEKMGGKLEVESTVGTGTIFLTAIPFQTEADRQH